MSNENNSSSGGIGFTGLIQLAFIVLKLTGCIEWPWLWVMAPTWIGLILGVLGFVVFVIIYRRWGDE